MSKRKNLLSGQLCFFQEEIPEINKAVSCLNDEEIEVTTPASWMLEMVPTGKYVAAGFPLPLILKPVSYSEKEIRTGFKFQHYKIGQQLYIGQFIGRRPDNN